MASDHAQITPSRVATATAWARVRQLSFIRTSWTTFFTVRSREAQVARRCPGCHDRRRAGAARRRSRGFSPPGRLGLVTCGAAAASRSPRQAHAAGHHRAHAGDEGLRGQVVPCGRTAPTPASTSSRSCLLVRARARWRPGGWSLPSASQLGAAQRGPRAPRRPGRRRRPAEARARGLRSPRPRRSPPPCRDPAMPRRTMAWVSSTHTVGVRSATPLVTPRIR